MNEFSVDLIHQIFIRIPVKSLLQLRVVSKSWCKIIDDPLFTYMQYDCGEVEQKRHLFETTDFSWQLWTLTLYAAAACDNEEARIIHAATVPMAKFPYISFLGSCHGLLYFAGHEKGRIVVSNPLKGQFKILPPIHLNVDYFWDSFATAIGLGFDSLTKTFKMVCSHESVSSRYFTVVHTLGTTSWRKVTSVPAYYCGRMDYKPVFVHGFLHWMIDPSMIKNSRGRILAFNVSKETFKVIPHPELGYERLLWERYFRLLDIKGSLGMLDLSCDGKIDIWVMDYDKYLWGKEYTIDITIVGRIDVDLTKVIGLWKQDEILFIFCYRDLSQSFVSYWSYSMRTGDIKECEVLSSKAKVYSFKGSLISVPGAREAS